VAHIRRTDGKPISTAPYRPEAVPVLSTMQFYDKEAALSEAKAMINRGAMR
jgi:hypothetical protein